ncbi:transporter substrate-binding domain-containing protein [Paracoccus marinaquae]|uniref:Transporter substrate-binding domain-containing protein n=1 Tax=Paracoccus marinaquae TaxID=2841926 RepID=A0ABS6AIF4_9RHOB|nr:transporter substrate-binding domain-containing protein [Paracoccus marinaquae]MBU3030380.1 transporter substrate-binding domain-containing protein [Paracoccus marinaquae]
MPRFPSICAAFGVAVMAAAPVFAACEGVAPEQRLQNTFPQDIGRSLDRIVEDGWIEVAVYEDFPPWSWEQDGRPMGIDVDLARLIGEGLGVEARIRMVQAGEMLDQDLLNYVYKGAVVGGRVSNLFLHVPYDVDYACRFDQVVFTGIYAEEHLAIAYRRADYPDKAPVPAYFRYDPVGVENDSISDFFLTSLVGSSADKMHRYASLAGAMAALAAGEVKAVMGPRAQLEAGAAEGIAIHEPPFLGLERSRWTLGLAVSTQHRPLAYAVDDVIAAAIADGRLQRIFAQYGVSYLPAAR